MSHTLQGTGGPGLDGIDDDFLMRERDCARLLAVTRRALQEWRRRGTGPRFVRISGRCVRYRKQDVLAWAAARVRCSTGEA